MDTQLYAPPIPTLSCMHPPIPTLICMPLLFLYTQLYAPPIPTLSCMPLLFLYTQLYAPPIPIHSAVCPSYSYTLSCMPLLFLCIYICMLSFISLLFWQMEIAFQMCGGYSSTLDTCVNIAVRKQNVDNFK